MPPSKGGKGGKERGSAIIGAKKESGLQAVVLIDSNTLSSSFAPLTSLDLPTFLLPVCGAPLLEYTLEFLAMQSAVNEIVLVSSRNAKTLRDYLSQSSRWSANLEDSISAAAASSSVSDTVVVDGLSNLARPKIRIPALSPACKTSGDEIRALESTGVLRSGSTFLLLEGLVVSNANLSAAIAAHEMRAKVDPNVTLTNVLVKRNQHHQTSLRTRTLSATTTTNTTNTAMAASIITQSSSSSSPDALVKSSIIGTPHFTRIEKALNRLHAASGQSLNEICIMTLDSADGRIWSYTLNPGSSHSDSISTAPVQRPEGASKDIAARLSRRSFLDVAETGIYICSPQVAIHFSDNYDYSSLRNHYIKNEVANIDMGWRFNVHIVSSCYAMQASLDPRSLMQANFDVAQGWCAPFTVDTIAGWPRASSSSSSSSSCGGTSFPFINLQDSFLFAKSHTTSATLKATSVTTSNTTRDSVSSTFAGANVVLGANCTIGEGAMLDRCMLSEGCVVGPGAIIRDSILFSSVVIEANARVTGAILGQGVVIKSKANVLSGAVLGGSVVIGEGHTVPLGARVTVAQRPSSVFQANDVLIVGAGGQGRAWPDTKQEGGGEGEDEEEEEDDNAITIGEAGLISAASSVALVSKRINELLKVEKEKTQGGDVSLSDLADAVRAAFKFKNLLTAPGLKNTLELGLCLVWGASTKELQRSTTLSSIASSSSSSTTTTSSFNSSNPFVGHGASSLDPALQRFSFGVYDLFFDGGSAPLPQNSGNLSLEIKSFKYAENRSTADCLNEVVPLVFGLLKGSMPVAVLKTHVSAWAPLLARFVVEPEDEVACISSLSKFICRPALRSLNNNVPPSSSATPDPRLMFGVIVNFLFDPEVAIVEGLVDDEGNERGVLTAEGIRAWSSRAWQAAGGDDDEDDEDGNSEIKNRENSEISASSSSLPDVSNLNVLLESKYWGLLQDRLDEEEDEDEEEEEEEGE